MHNMLFLITAIPELSMEEAEAKKLAEAVRNVTRHYDIPVTQKALDWSNLMGVLAMTYGTRVFAAATRVREEKAAKKEAQPNAAPYLGVVR